MATEIQQLLLNALTNLTKEYQKQSNEQIERENLLISALEQNTQKLLIESLRKNRTQELQVSSLIEQNRVLSEQLVQLMELFTKG